MYSAPLCFASTAKNLKTLLRGVCVFLFSLRHYCFLMKQPLYNANLKHDVLFFFIIKFRYNARSDWLKERALSEYRCTVR